MTRNVYSVTQVNSYIKNMFTQDYMLQTIFIKGEVSNCKYHSSGHIYFTLKDSKGTLNCVMFAGNRSGLSFQMKEGQQIIALGTIDVYERDGKYQLYVKQIELDGAGVLYEKFEKLKTELAEQGMFALEYKQTIPKYAEKIGIVTADTGAAVRDIIQIATRRNPYVQLILYPAIVQGNMAVESIIKGINALEKQQVDIIIVGRGGGSIEDLWAFNEKAVAQAVFDCTVPIISAVGHETDTTIIDYVADLRAPTPSAAAELAVFDFMQWLENINTYEERFMRGMKRNFDKYHDKIKQYEISLKYLSPLSRLQQKRNYLIQLEDRLEKSIEKKIFIHKTKLSIYIEKMKGLSPIEKLNSGFSYVANCKGENIRSVEKVKIKDEILITLSDGKLYAMVNKIEKEQ